MGPRITISNCYRVISCTGSLGHKICTKFVQGSNSKVASMLSRTILKIPISFRIYWRKDQRSFFVKQVQMIQICWQWSQNVHLTQQKRSANGHQIAHYITMSPKHATHSKLFWIWIVLTRRTFWEHCQQNWGIFTCLTPVDSKYWPLTFS